MKRMFKGSVGIWNADAADWIRRVQANDGAVSTATANAVTDFCNAIDAAGIRDRFYRLNLFCGTGLNACLVPLYTGPKQSDGRNILAASQELSSTAWTKDAVSITADSVTAPDETGTADVMTEDGTASTHRVYQAFTATADTSIAISCYVKRTSGTRNINIRAQAGGSDNIQATFDLATGVATPSQAGTGVVASATATAYGDWWRVALVGKPSTSTANPSLSIYLHNGTSASYTGDGSSAVAMWGVQAEYGTAATEYNGSRFGNTTDTNNGPFVPEDYAETGAGGGLTGNGSTKYLNTGLSVSNIGTYTSGHLSAYHGQSSGSNSNRYYIAANDSVATNRFWLGTDAYSVAQVQAIYGATLAAVETLASQSHGTAGHRIVSRESSTSLTHYHNGSAVATNTSDVTGGGMLSTAAFPVFAYNSNGSISRLHNSWIAGYSIGLGLDATQAAAYRSAMQNFQAALGRSV